MTDQPKKIAIIGAGNIAKFHIPALRLAGLECEHCASRPNSQTIHNFARNHNIKNIWINPKELAAKHEEWDGILISVAVEPTFELLEIAMASGKPVLVEKPVCKLSSKLELFSHQPPPNVMVAYNRRHYSTVNRARNFVSDKKGVRAIMLLPENVSSDFEDPFHLIYENSVHGLDLLSYIFGSLQVEHISINDRSNPLMGCCALLRSSAGHLITLIMNWGAPSNFSLSIDVAQERFDLNPFEKYQQYNGISVIEPTNDYSIRQYVPKLVEKGTVFDNAPKNIKPGFGEQAREFARLINGIPFKVSANLSDAYKAQLLAEKLMEPILRK